MTNFLTANVSTPFAGDGAVSPTEANTSFLASGTGTWRNGTGNPNGTVANIVLRFTDGVNTFDVTVVGASITANNTGNPKTFSWSGTVSGLSGVPSFAIGTYSVSVLSISTDGTAGLTSTPVPGISVACYLRGTRILTPAGEVAVEDLAIGDLVVTSSGAHHPITWIGIRGYVTQLVAPNQRTDMLPIRFARGSLGNNLPKRDLFVSPQHAMCLDNQLFLARDLVNGASIAYCDSFPTIEYFHIELPSHEIIYAEGAAAESWLDCDNRNVFTNVLDYLKLDRPESTAKPTRCLPLVREGVALHAARRKLAEHIRQAGFEFSKDPEPRLLVDGGSIPGKRVTDLIYSWTLPSAPKQLALTSRTAVPAEVLPDSTDRRVLGMRVAKILLKSAGLTIEIGHDHLSLGDGFHKPEATHRWTKQKAMIPQHFLDSLSGQVTVEVHLSGIGLPYTIRSISEGEVIPFSSWQMLENAVTTQAA